MTDPSWETCPYEKSHTFPKSRMQFHLSKCRAQHPEMKKEVCPYNSTHHFNYVEKEFHLKNCPDQKDLDRFLYEVGSNTPPIGLQPVRSFTVPSVSEEDWDSDTPTVSVLDQVKQGVQHKGVRINKVGAPKAERKAHRFSERLRYQAVGLGNPQLNEISGQSSQSNVLRAPVNHTPQPTLQNAKQENCEPQPTENPLPTNILSAVYVGEKNVNASDFPVLGRKEGNTPVSEKMSALSVGNSDDQNGGDDENIGEPVPPPNPWGRPLTRTQDEKISWPAGTAPTRAPSSPGFTGSSAMNAIRPATTSRPPSNPWATNVNQQRSEPGPAAHLASAAPPRAAPPAAAGSGANSAINGIWARGIAFNNAQARMTSDDFPTLPISARGRKPRP